jgi:subfamily B ATP-binding cassette protein HlyB/CyaB
MAAICRHRTVFIIAHRLSTVRQCDRIIVLEKGRIVEQGNHEGLLKANGYYAKLHSYQNHTPILRQVPKQSERQVPASRNKRSTMGEGNKNNQIKQDSDTGQGIVSRRTEIEEVDESWAIDMLEEIEKEESENDNREKR